MAFLKLNYTDTDSILKLRASLRLNQTEFWARVGTTQSGGCRYEQGRSIPGAVLILLHLAYASDEEAVRLLADLRTIELE